MELPEFAHTCPVNSMVHWSNHNWLNFLHQFCPGHEGAQQHFIGLHQIWCTLIWLQVIVSLGGLSRYVVFSYFLNTTRPSLTKVIYPYWPILTLSPIKSLFWRVKLQSLYPIIIILACYLKISRNFRNIYPVNLYP